MTANPKSKKRTVKEVIEWLQKQDPDAICYAYEGEISCIVVCHNDERRYHENIYLETAE